MNSEELKTFIFLSKVKNFTLAAEQLFIAQSTVTNRINELEKEVGKRLFIRGSKTVKLTEAGEIFLRYAERILECVRAQMVKNIYAATLTPDQMDIMMQTDGRVKGIVEVGVYELIAADGFDDFRTKLSERLTGSLLLKDVRYQLLGLDDGFLYFEVSGDASEILAPVSEPENNE